LTKQVTRDGKARGEAKEKDLKKKKGTEGPERVRPDSRKKKKEFAEC